MKRWCKVWMVPWLALVFGIAVTVIWSCHSWRQIDFFTAGTGPQVAAYSDCSSVSFYFLETPSTIGVNDAMFKSAPGYRTETVTPEMWEGLNWFGDFVITGSLRGIIPEVIFVRIPIWLLMAPTVVPLALMVWDRHRAALAEG